MVARVGVGCIVLRAHPDAPVLLLLRAFGELAGSWCFVAGTVEPGELPRDAAARELREETGIERAELSRLLVHDDEPDLELHVFVARVPDAAQVRLNSEHSSFCWLSFDAARAQLPTEAQRRALDRARTA